jgi:hypothetical protein
MTFVISIKFLRQLVMRLKVSLLRKRKKKEIVSLINYLNRKKMLQNYWSKI